MKKITLCLLAAAIIGTSGFASAAKLSGAPAVPVVKTRLAGAHSDSFYVYCHYINYNVITGHTYSKFTRSYSRYGFGGCPRR